MTEIVDPPKRIDARGLLRRSPLERAEVVDVEVAASLARKQQRRTVAVPDPVECVEGTRLQRYGSHARLRLRELELAAGERAADIDDPLLAVNVALLECGPLRRS